MMESCIVLSLGYASTYILRRENKNVSWIPLQKAIALICKCFENEHETLKKMMRMVFVNKMKIIIIIIGLKVIFLFPFSFSNLYNLVYVFRNISKCNSLLSYA